MDLQKQEMILGEILEECDFEEKKNSGVEITEVGMGRSIVEYTCGLSSRAKEKGFRERMIKIAALTLAAIEAWDAGTLEKAV